MKTLAEKYEKIVNKYVEKFRRKHGFDSGYWISNGVGEICEICEICDMFLDFRDIKYDIDTEQPEENVYNWNWLRTSQNMDINYKSYCLGLRPAEIIELERIESLEKSKQDLKKVTDIFQVMVALAPNKATT